MHADQCKTTEGKCLHIVILQHLSHVSSNIYAQAYSRLIVTCSTFALYTASFTKSANQALAAADTPEGDQAMAKRWDFLGKFETNFNHWCAETKLSVKNVH